MLLMVSRRYAWVDRGLEMAPLKDREGGVAKTCLRSACWGSMNVIVGTLLMFTFLSVQIIPQRGNSLMLTLTLV